MKIRGVPRYEYSKMPIMKNILEEAKKVVKVMDKKGIEDIKITCVDTLIMEKMEGE
jgi:hypothetical protein